MDSKQDVFCRKKYLSNRTAAAAKSLQSCPTLCDPGDGSPPGSDVPGILQARTLEWVAISAEGLEVYFMWDYQGRLHQQKGHLNSGLRK